MPEPQTYKLFVRDLVHELIEEAARAKGIA